MNCLIGFIGEYKELIVIFDFLDCHRFDLLAYRIRHLAVMDSLSYTGRQIASAFQQLDKRPRAQIKSATFGLAFWLIN